MSAWRNPSHYLRPIRRPSQRILRDLLGFHAGEVAKVTDLLNHHVVGFGNKTSGSPVSHTFSISRSSPSGMDGFSMLAT
jgi:hypothetical protein